MAFTKPQPKFIKFSVGKSEIFHATIYYLESFVEFGRFVQPHFQTAQAVDIKLKLNFSVLKQNHTQLKKI